MPGAAQETKSDTESRLRCWRENRSIVVEQNCLTTIIVGNISRSVNPGISLIEIPPSRKFDHRSADLIRFVHR